MSHEVVLLRRIEDAERSLNQYQRIKRSIMTGAVAACLGIVASSELLYTGGWAVGALIVSGLLLLASLGVLPWWIWWNHSESERSYSGLIGYRRAAPGPAEKLREERRRYEDYLSSQGGVS